MKNIKIILLSPVVFDKHNHDLVEQVTLKLYEENEVKIFSDNEWETLDGEEVCLNNTDGAIDIRDAIWKERNLNPKMYKNFIKPISTEYENSSLILNANLIVDEKCDFLMLFEFTFTNLKFNNSADFVKKLIDNRNLFLATNNTDFYEKVKIKSMGIINDAIKKILNSNSFMIAEKNFTMDSNYPLIFINGFTEKENFSQVFSNEENFNQSRTSSLLSEDNDNEFSHIGWNYGIVKNLPKNSSEKYLSMLIFLQLHYYLLRFYKNYFQNKILRLSNQNVFEEREIKNFDKLKILYHKEYLVYKTYKSGLYPKYYEEFKSIEDLWHIEEDINFIEKTFEVQNEYMNKHFQRETEKTNRNLNYGITVIGLIQIFTFYGVVDGYLSFNNDYPQYINYVTGSIILTVGLLGIFVWKIFKKAKVKK